LIAEENKAMFAQARSSAVFVTALSSIMGDSSGNGSISKRNNKLKQFFGEEFEAQAVAATLDSEEEQTDDPTIIKQGFLLKQGHAVLKDWKPRWTVLCRDTLRYYKFREDPAPLGEISLAHTTTKLSQRYTDRYCFEIQCPNINKTYFMVAENYDQMISWVNAIQSVEKRLSAPFPNSSESANPAASRKGTANATNSNLNNSGRGDTPNYALASPESARPVSPANIIQTTESKVLNHLDAGTDCLSQLLTPTAGAVASSEVQVPSRLGLLPGEVAVSCCTVKFSNEPTMEMFTPNIELTVYLTNYQLIFYTPVKVSQPKTAMHTTDILLRIFCNTCRMAKFVSFHSKITW
jgi:hypothetical protein